MPRIDAFLKLGLAQGCSDVHLAVGVPPMLRMHGDLMPIKFRELADTELAHLATLPVQAEAVGDRDRGLGVVEGHHDDTRRLLPAVAPLSRVLQFLGAPAAGLEPVAPQRDESVAVVDQGTHDIRQVGTGPEDALVAIDPSALAMEQHLDVVDGRLVYRMPLPDCALDDLSVTVITRKAGVVADTLVPAGATRQATPRS